MKKLLLLTWLLLCLPNFAWAANQSTIDPTVPATDADLESGPIRDNFLAAWNDINAIWASIGTTLFGANQVSGTLVAGPTQGLPMPSCFGPASALIWTNGVGFGCNNVLVTGAVSSVAFGGDGIFDSAVPSAAVTSTGVVVATPLQQLPNMFPAGPVSGALAATPSWRLLVGADLPNPSLSAKGGIVASTAPAHSFATSLGVNGQLGYTIPLCGDVGNAGSACTANVGTSGASVPLLNGNVTFSGAVNFAGSLQVNGVSLAASATTDTTNASNITSGSLAYNRLTPIANNTVLGNVSGGVAAPTALTQGQAAALVESPVTTQTANYTLQISDRDGFINMNCSLSCAVTVPPNSSVAYPIGAEIAVYQSNTGAASFAAGAGVTINSPSTLTLFKQFSTAAIKQVSANVWVLAGSIQ